MAPVLRSYVAGGWQAPSDEGRPLFDAVTGDEVARISSAGIDMAGVLDHGRIGVVTREEHRGVVDHRAMLRPTERSVERRSVDAYVCAEPAQALHTHARRGSWSAT